MLLFSIINLEGSFVSVQEKVISPQYALSPVRKIKRGMSTLLMPDMMKKTKITGPASDGGGKLSPITTLVF